MSGLAWIACVSLCVIYPVSFPPGVIVCRGICLAPTMSLRDRWTFVLTAPSLDLLTLVGGFWGLPRLVVGSGRGSVCAPLPPPITLVGPLVPWFGSVLVQWYQEMEELDKSLFSEGGTAQGAYSPLSFSVTPPTHRQRN